MLHPDLADLLRRRRAVVADHDLRDRDADAHLAALREVSEAVLAWHQLHRGTLPPRLEHFLANGSYDKALRYLDSDGTWTGH